MDPLISVIVPAYRSQRTALRTLQGLVAQQGVRFEVIVVDSSAQPDLGTLIASRFPQIRYIHSPQRLLPHAARNLGATHARGRLLVFTDPDAYAHPDWLHRLVMAYERTGAIVVGGVACYGRNWFDQGVHLTKYDAWLPRGAARPIRVAPTVNVLYPAKVFFASGGFRGDLMLGDTELSWRMTRRGQAIWFEPCATVEHHHLADWGSFVRERFERGRSTGLLLAEHANWRRWRLWVWLLISLLPLRLASQLVHSATNAVLAGQGLIFLLTLPVILAGRWAWVLGEACGYVRVIFDAPVLDDVAQGEHSLL